MPITTMKQSVERKRRTKHICCMTGCSLTLQTVFQLLAIATTVSAKNWSYTEYPTGLPRSKMCLR